MRLKGAFEGLGSLPKKCVLGRKKGDEMMDNYSGKDKREFFRYSHEKPVQYKVLGSPDKNTAESSFIDAVSKNLSASGVLFTSSYLPKISSVIVIDLDYRTSRVCQEIDSRAMIVDNKMVGKIVRIEENSDGAYDVGVAFVKKSEKLPKDIKDLLR